MYVVTKQVDMTKQHMLAIYRKIRDEHDRGKKKRMENLLKGKSPKYITSFSELRSNIPEILKKKYQVRDFDIILISQTWAFKDKRTREKRLAPYKKFYCGRLDGIQAILKEGLHEQALDHYIWRH